jgi:hypothetical protein
MNISSACMCVCAPVGHHHGVCQSTAEPGLFVALNRAHGRPVRLPSCRPCHEAVRRQLWAGVHNGHHAHVGVGSHRPASLRATA